MPCPRGVAGVWRASGRAGVDSWRPPLDRAPTPLVVTAAALADELAELAGLRDQGILTPAEFEQRKARLLGRSGPS
ncbi:SHOCT domain-containing protein [Streptomyces sp. NPDC088180]|uniref:SHOCT domain-containing protein n=1 Tax=Streptomyces sp. NPDC088180 TaxID=3365837 RepID=UPI00381AF19A